MAAPFKITGRKATVDGILNTKTLDLVIDGFEVPIPLATILELMDLNGEQVKLTISEPDQEVNSNNLREIAKQLGLLLDSQSRVIEDPSDEEYND